MNYNKIPVAFGVLRKVSTPPINYQYDQKQILVIKGLELPEFYTVDFCNEGDSVTKSMVGTAEGVEIPDEYLLTGKNVKAYIVITDGESVQTRYEVTIPVKVRPQRTDIEPTPEEQSVINGLVAAMNTAVTESRENADRAETAVSHYPKIEAGNWYVWNPETGAYEDTGIQAEGEDGVGIQSATLNANFTLTLTFTDGTSYTTPSIRGEQGQTGQDGVSPTITVTAIMGGHRVEITDAEGTKTFSVMDGQTGATPDLQIGTVTTLPAGSEATAEITGTPEQPRLNLGIPKGDTGEVSQAEFDDLSGTVSNLNRQISDEIANTNDSLLNLNDIPVNVEYIEITDSTITQAQDRNVQLTVTGINKFKLNGTASSTFTIPFDWKITEIGGANTLYYLISRNDGINKQDGVWVQLGWFLADDSEVQPVDKIKTFNEVVSYTYPATAVTTRNYLRVGASASFNNTEFEIVIMRKPPLDADLITKVDTMLLADSYNEVPLTWTLATGYWANNKTFATYNNVYTATVDVVSGDKYMLDAKSYYGMCIGVYYSGDTISAESIVDIIHLSNDDTWHYKYETQVPKDAEHLLLQQCFSNRATLRKISKNSVVKTSLSGKTIAYDGDSIAESRLTGNATNGGAYPYLIAEATGGFFVNKAVSGGILASAVPQGTLPHSVVNSLPSMPNDADLYCFEGGLNDYYLNVPLGDYSPTDFDSTVDTTTVCGALEHILRAATYNWVGKPICFVIVHSAVGTINANSAGYTFNQMREKLIGICHKYAIPFYDAYTESGLNGYNDIQNQNFLTGGTSKPYDGIHPNKAGYIRYYVPQLIQLFERIMPVNEEN